MESGLLLSRKECLEVSTLFEILITTFFVKNVILATVWFGAALGSGEYCLDSIKKFLVERGNM